MKQLIIGGYNSSPNNTTARTNTLAGGYNWIWDSTVKRQLVTTPGTFSELAVELPVAPGAGKSLTFTLVVNGVASALSVTISDTNTTGVDAVNTKAVVASDNVYLYCTPAGTPTVSAPRWSIVFDGTNAKESLLLSCSQCDLDENIYAPLIQGSSVFGASEKVETNCFTIIPTNGTIKDLYAELTADPGTAPDAYKIILRVNEADSDDGGGNSLEVTIVANNTTGNDTTHEIPVVAGDRVNWKIEPIDTPTVEPYIYIGATFEADTDGESILSAQTDANPTLSSTRYNNINTSFIGIPWTAVEANIYQLGWGGFGVKNLYVWVNSVLGVGASYIFNVRATSVPGDTGITATIIAGAQTANDTVNTYELGDYDDLSISLLAVVQQRHTAWSLVCYEVGGAGGSGDKSSNMGAKMIGANLI